MREKRNDLMEDEYTEIVDEKVSPPNGFDEKTAKLLQPLIGKFLRAYTEKPDDVQDSSWLDEHLQEELPEKSSEEIAAMRQEIQKTVAVWDKNIQSITEACAQGQTKEEWLEGKLSEAAIGVNVQDYGDYLAVTDAAIHQANQEAIQNIDNMNFNPSREDELSEGQEWNTSATHELAIQLGKELDISNLASTVMGTGWKLAEQLPFGDKLTEIKEVGDALRSGDDQGIKEAASAALTTGVEKGYIPFLPKGTPTSVVSGLACFGVEQAKVVLKFADGDISSGQALNLMGRVTMVNAANIFSNIGEKIGRQVGQKIGMAVAAVIPVLAPVGMAVGTFVGATVGRIGGSMIGKAVTKAAKKLAEAAKPVLKRAWEGIKSVGRSIMNGIKNLFSIFE